MDDELIASQEAAVLAAAMAREGLADAGLIEGAGLTEAEARALWTLEALGCRPQGGREES